MAFLVLGDMLTYPQVCEGFCCCDGFFLMCSFLRVWWLIKFGGVIGDDDAEGIEFGSEFGFGEGFGCSFVVFLIARAEVEVFVVVQISMLVFEIDGASMAFRIA
jgi:hypothetical protein